MPIRLYLDTNVFCRPFDDQALAKVHAEAQAFSRILDKVTEAEVTLTGSEILVLQPRDALHAASALLGNS